MKKLNILLLIIFIGIDIFPQVQPKKSVMDFFTTVENYTKDYNRTNEGELFKSKNYSKEEALSLAKQYSNAIAEDPVGFYSYLRERRKEFDEKFKQNGHWVRTNELMFVDKVSIIYKIISSYYGRDFTNIITIPWYLKVYVIDIRRGKVKTSVGILPKTYLVARVEEVIKGKNFFKEGDTIEINFLNNWLMDPNNQFKKNNSYFTGLRDWGSHNRDSIEIAIDVFPDKDNGVYPIKNGRIVAPDNYFGISNNLTWSEFRYEFVKKYILIV